MTISCAQARDYAISRLQRIPASNGGRWRPGWIVISYLVLPNLTLVFSMILLHISPHGYIDIEYLLLGARGMWLPRYACFALLMGESVADFAYTVCYTYHFSPSNLLCSLDSLLALPGARVSEGGLLFASSLFVSGTLGIFLPMPRSRS